jgi:hypothetical protein
LAKISVALMPGSLPETQAPGKYATVSLSPP